MQHSWAYDNQGQEHWSKNQARFSPSSALNIQPQPRIIPLGYLQHLKQNAETGWPAIIIIVIIITMTLRPEEGKTPTRVSRHRHRQIKIRIKSAWHARTCVTYS